jgi:hypothetical protein
MHGQQNYKCDWCVSCVSLILQASVVCVVYCCMGLWIWLSLMGLHGLGHQSHSRTLPVRTIQTQNVRHMSILRIQNPHSHCPYGIRCYMRFDHTATVTRSKSISMMFCIKLCCQWWCVRDCSLFCSVVLFLCFPFSLCNTLFWTYILPLYCMVLRNTSFARYISICVHPCIWR